MEKITNPTERTNSSWSKPMATAYHHALSSAKKWGGSETDYIKIHEWFDESKLLFSDFRHRALRHHTEGIQQAVKLFGDENGTITNSNGRKIPVLWIAEQHVQEDCGYLPTFACWVKQITPEPWMNRPIRLHKTLEEPKNG